MLQHSMVHLTYEPAQLHEIPALGASDRQQNPVRMHSRSCSICTNEAANPVGNNHGQPAP
jgi:hypothetical protein